MRVLRYIGFGLLLLFGGGGRAAAEIRINEFLAGNDTVLADEDGEFSDWIELHNDGDSAENLDGWFLTDDASDLDKWRIPNVVLSKDAYLVIFASAKNRTNALSELHTSFRISSSGEYLALVRPDGSTVEQDFGPMFPEQLDDVSYGLLLETVPLVPEGADCRYLVPPNNSEALNWTGAPGYNDVWWNQGQAALGFDNGLGTYRSHIFTDLATNMFGVNDSVYLRIPFSADTGYERIRLNMKYDDGFIAYLNGSPVLSVNAPAPAWNASATATHDDALAVQAASFVLTNAVPILHLGTNNLLAIHGLNANPDDPEPDFLIVPELVAEREITTHLETPTPGQPNSGGLLLADVGFSVQRGFFDAPFQLALTSSVAGAEIRYTLDFSEPTETAALYTGLITVTNSTVIRAAAFKPGFRPSPSHTKSYLYLEDVLTQPNNPPGFPALWGTQTAEYLMRSTTVDQYTEEEFTGFLKYIPTVSIVSEMGNLFDPATGIYHNNNANNRGVAWERPVSVEYINTNGVSGFGLNCGMRIQGGAGGGGRLFKKKSLRLLFKSQYGPSKLRYDLYEGDRGATDVFDQLILRRGGNDSQDYTRDEYARRCQQDIGGAASHGRFVQVYINGLYWGMYNIVERPAGDFAASYFGGEKEDYDALAHGANNVIDGDNLAWNAMVNAGRAGLANNDDYLAIQGLDPNRERDPNLPVLIDVDNHIDYMLANIYLGMGDWPHHNWYAARKRSEDSTGYKFFVWDGEGAFSTADRTGVDNGIAEPWGDLRANGEFNLRVADRVQNYFFNDGALTPLPAQERFLDLSDSMEFGVITEAARWGRIAHASWITRRDQKVNYLGSRASVVLGFLRNANLYPDVEAPVLNQYGGVITNGFALSMSSSDASEIWYSLDNSDPRAFGSGAPLGIRYTNAVSLAWSVIVKARARKADGTWSALVEELFTVDEPLSLRVSELMFHARDPMGAETNVATSSNPFDYIELKNTGAQPIGLAGLQLTDGIQFSFSEGTVPVLQPGELVVVVDRLAAFTHRYPGFSGLIAGEFQGDLDNDGEEIRLRDVQGNTLLSFDYGDGREWPLAADGAGHALVPIDFSNQPNDSLDYAGNWRVGTFIDGSPGVDDPTLPLTLQLNELAAIDDWVEIFNASGSAVSLTDWYVSNDPDDLARWSISGTGSVPSGDWASFDPGFELLDDGDRMYLSHLPGTAADRVVDAISFRAQEAGVTVGRISDGTGRWQRTEPTRDASNTAINAGVVIHEFMYHPRPTEEHPEDNQHDEYIELMNGSAVPVDLFNTHGSWRIDGGVEFDLPASFRLAPGERAVLVSFDPANAVELASFRRAYGLAPGEGILLGPWEGNLSNRGERIELEKPTASGSWVTVDEVAYFDRAPWPVEADGTGRPLLRTNAQAAGNDPANWEAGFAPSPGLAQPAIVFVEPDYGATLLNPAAVPAEASVDPTQVVGAIQQVAFYINGASECVDTTPPFTCDLSSIGTEGTYQLTATFSDNAGVHTSRVVEVVFASVSNQPASSLGRTTATLNGLISQDGRAYVQVYWGLSDGGTNPGNWDAVEDLGWTGGAFAAPVNGLLASAPYYYRCFVSNDYGAAWAPVSEVFTTAPARVALNLQQTAISENGGSTLLNATLAEVSLSNITVNLSFAGSAILHVDYTAEAMSVLIPAGDAVASIRLDGVNDALLEDPETILVSIDSVSNAVPGTPSLVDLALISDDVAVNNLPATNITEYTVTLGGELRFGNQADVTMYWGASDGGTNAGAWEHAEFFGSLGEVLFETNIVGLLASQTYYFRAYAENADGGDWADGTSQFVSTLTGISVHDTSFVEGDLGHTAAWIDVSLSATSAVDAVVHYVVSNRTAEVGLDVEADTGAFVLPAGAVTGRIELAIIGDVLDESPSEQFFVQLSAPSNAVLVDAQAEVTIRDDDADVRLVDWLHSQQVSFPGYTKAETLIDFPVLVKLSGIDYSQFALPGAGDLRFTDNQVVLDYELERWDTNGTSLVWVRLPELRGTNTTIWARWGNPSANLQPGEVFSAGYRGVYHFAEGTGNLTGDASPQEAQGSLKNMSNADWIEAVVGTGLDFDGGNDGVDTPIVIDQGASSPGATFSAWVLPHTANGPNERIIASEDGGWDWSLVINSAPRYDVFTGNGQLDAGHVPDLNAWQYLAAVFDPGTAQIRVYKNGQEAVLSDLGFDDSSRALSIGSSISGNPFDGRLDEVRIAEVPRSADWVCAAWLNMASNEVFNRVEPVESTDQDAASLLLVYGATNVLDVSAHLTARITATGTLASAIDFYWGRIDGGTDTNSWSHHRSLGVVPPMNNLDVQVAVSNLLPNTRYHYAVRSSNAQAVNWARTPFVTIGPPAVANTGPRDEDVGSAVLGTALTRAGEAAVTVFWGRSDGGTSASGWEHQTPVRALEGAGQTRFTVDGLFYGQTYYYRSFASNEYGTAWSDGATPFFSVRPASIYEPGLYGAALPGNLNATDPNPNTEVFLGPHAAADRALPPWGGNTTWVYTGQVFLDGRAAYFAENIDDKVQLTIDGALVIDNAQWSVPSGTGPINKPAGWYDFELRMSNGGGGAGPVGNNGWSNTKGFGLAYNITEGSPPQGGQYLYPEDDGSGSLFRHLPEAAGEGGDLSIFNGGISELRGGSARAHASMIASGSVFQVWVHWGENDGGTNTWEQSAPVGMYTNVASQSVSGVLGRLMPETTYFYRFSMSNAVEQIWAQASRTFVSGVDPNQFTRRMKISFPEYNAVSTLTNFPALVTFDEGVPGFTYASFASPMGHDLRFTDPDGTTLSFEIESWDPNGTSWAWVRIPELDSSGSDFIWAYWGNAGASIPAYATNGLTWSEDFVGVWHFSATNAFDSGPGRVDTEAVGTPGWIVHGHLAGAHEFEADADYHRAADRAAFTLANDYTVTAWINSHDIGSQNEAFVGTFNGEGFIFALQNNGANTLRFWTDGVWRSSNTSVPDDQWVQVAYTRRGSVGRFYMNGQEVAVVNNAIAGSNGGELQLGAGGASWPNERFDGLLDEVRISHAERSADWLRASWLNQWSNQVFLAYGGVELVDPNLPGIVNATEGATAVQAGSATLNGTLLSTGAAPTEVWVYWGTTDEGTNLSWTASHRFGVHAGPLPEAFAHTATSLLPNTTYYYGYRAVNAFGSTWAFRSTAFSTLVNTDFDGDGIPDALDPDDDNDGALDVDEAIAGTDPLDASSVLRLDIGPAGPATYLLMFPSLTNRVYDVEVSDNLQAGPWTPLITDHPGQPDMTHLLQTNGVGRLYYRLRVRPAP